MFRSKITTVRNDISIVSDTEQVSGGSILNTKYVNKLSRNDFATSDISLHLATKGIQATVWRLYSSGMVHRAGLPVMSASILWQDLPYHMSINGPYNEHIQTVISISIPRSSVLKFLCHDPFSTNISSIMEIEVICIRT